MPDERTIEPPTLADHHLAEPEPELKPEPEPEPRRGGKAAWWMALVIVLLLGGAVAFASQIYLPLRAQLADLEEQLVQIEEENDGLKEQVGSLARLRRELEAAKQALAGQLKTQEEALEELQQAQQELSTKLAEQVRRGEVMIKQNRGQLVVDLIDKLLFETAEAELNDSGKKVLTQVADTFHKMKDKVIQVGGHTDAVPISEKLIERYPSNWELSTARATHVVRFLQDECKIPGSRLMAVGFAEYRPTASNRTSAGRRRNRRIEVVLLPSKQR